MHEQLFKVVSVAVLCLAAVMLPFVVFGDNGIKRVNKLEEQVERIRDKNKVVEWEILELRREIKHIRDNPQIVKQVAREELGYVTSEEKPETLVFPFLIHVENISHDDSEQVRGHQM